MRRLAPVLLLLRFAVPFGVLATPALAQAPRVTAVSPVAEIVGAERGGDLTVQFDEALDPATVSAASFRVLGRWTGPVAGALTLEDENRRIRFNPDASIAAGDLVLVQLARTITTAGGTPMAHGYAWSFWTETKVASFDFVEMGRLSLRREGEGDIIVYGAHGGDLNGDGLSDLITSQEAANDARVLLNDGIGPYDDFTVFPLPGAAVPSPLEGADLNHDGLLDIVIGSTQNDKVHVLIGDGAGDFASIVAYPTTGTSNRGVALGDFDGDGHDDIVTANRNGGSMSLLRGNGDGTFEAAVGFQGGGSNETAVVTTDANGDGLLDLFVGDNAGGVSACLGDGEGTFTCGPNAGLPNGGPWMIAAGDLDADGDADVVVASSSANGVEVLYGDGTGGFESTTFLSSGFFPIAIDMGDLDGDGDLDVVSSNYGSGDFSVFQNIGGTLVFAYSLDAESAGSCMTLHDRNGDGILDMTGIDERADLALFFETTAIPATEPDADEDGLALTPTANPFRGRTALQLHLPAPGAVRLVVFDARGREVAVLLDGTLPAGERTVPWDASALPAGRYLARLEAGGAGVSVPLTLVR